MKNSSYFQFIDTLIMLLIISGISVACAVRLKSPYITGLNPSIVGQRSEQPIVPVPIMDQSVNLTKGLGIQTEQNLQLILETVLFEFDKATLLPEGQLKIVEFVKIIQQQDSQNILIEGHTDDIGEEDYNQDLSERRAHTIYETLKANGVEQERLIIRGIGEHKPIAPNTMEEGRQKNRRVEITVLPRNGN